MTHWYVYRDGKLEPSERSSWMGEGESGKETWAAGFTKNMECGEGRGCYSVTIYEHDKDPRWLFCLGGDPGYTVEVEGFPDYLEFLSKVAPVAAVGVLSDRRPEPE
jgi:hypothetical protein